MITMQTTKIDQYATDENTNDADDTLIALHNRSVDALTGFAKMVEKAEPSFRSVPEEFRALHARQTDRIARILAERGCEVDPNGTFMGTVNVAVVSLRALFDTIDEGVMANIRSGERSVLAAFDDALAANLDATTKMALTEMRTDLSALLDRTSHLD